MGIRQMHKKAKKIGRKDLHGVICVGQVLQSRLETTQKSLNHKE